MRGKKIIVVLTLVVIGIILLSIFVVTTQNEIKNINKEFEEIKNKPLSLKILADTSSGTSPLTVNFKILLFNNKNQVKYYWEFGDGNASNEKEPSNIYKSSGMYSCKLTVEDGDITISDNYNVSVFQNNPPDVKIIVDKTTGFRPVTINFDAQVFDPEGDDLEYLWQIKYPPFFSKERVDAVTEKSFSKKFIRNGNYVAELTVTDETGNSGTQYVRIQILKSKAEVNIQTAMVGVTTFKTIIWPILEGLLGQPLYDLLDSFWLKIPKLQGVLLVLLDLFGIDYDPIIPIANLEFSEISDINHTITVNPSGGVPIEASESSFFTIKNNDSENKGKNIYITLENPLSQEKGLVNEIEIKELEVSIVVDGITNKLFYDGEYKPFNDCYFIEKLAYGDEFSGEIVVTLKEAENGKFTDNETYNCNLYVYQEKAQHVNKIPFRILT